MSSVCDYWLKSIKRAEESKKPFTEVGEMCRQFFSGSVGFMWDDKFRNKHLKNIQAPRFRVTIAKAFELVAIFGPSLFWRYPGRTIKSREIFQPDPSLFGDPEDPAVQQILQQVQAELQQEAVARTTRDKLMSLYLNYSQREQPGGGLKCDGQYAVTEALVKGRGVLWTEAYKFPGSERVLTGSFFDSVDNLFIDPSSVRPNLTDCHWIARKHVQQYWEVERRFKLPAGSLRGKATRMSADAVSHGETVAKSGNGEIRKDLITWYEVFSKGGVGTRNEGILDSMHSAFEDVIGDFAYICVCQGVDYPLNAPPAFMDQATDEDVLEAFDWPVPYYKDGKWPCSILDFYPNPNSCWPLAPMAMGLGELIFLNTMMSVLCERTYESSRLIVAAIKGAASEAVQKIRSGGMKEIIEIEAGALNNFGGINNLIQVLQMPEMGFDLFRMINMVSAMFDKRTGLSELLYGMNPGGAASRTAADINVKSEMASVRPEYMSQQVEEWQTEVANLERIAAGWSVIGEDIKPLLGNVGAEFWDRLISGEDPEVFVREMRCTVEANSIRKPNKVRDNENINRISQFLFPELSKHAQITGDTVPINNFISDLGVAMDQDTNRWAIPSRQQEPDEQQMQLQQQQAELDLAEKQARVQKLTAEAENYAADSEARLAELDGMGDGEAGEGAEMDRKAAEMQMNMQAKEMESMLGIESMAAEKALELQFQQDMRQLDRDASET
jgi:hypothetical protein